MKKIIFIFCCFITLSVYSQSVEDNPEVRNWLDNMFQHLDKSKFLTAIYVTMLLN